MTGRLGVALFGLGRAGQIHIHNIIKNYRMHLLYVVEVEVQMARDYLDKLFLTDVKVVKPEDVKKVYQDNRVEAVLVCSITSTHEGIVTASLQHGKAVFCEKPIALSLEATQRCYQEAEKQGKPLLCSFNRRFDPALQKLKKRVDTGDIGDVHVIKTCARDNPLPPMSYLAISGGIFHDCVVHDLDLICWTLGEWPESVYTQATCHNKDIRAMDDVDTLIVMLRFPSGVLATIDASRHAAYGYDQRLEVFGSKGMLVSSHQSDPEPVAFTPTATVEPPIKYSFQQRYRESYVISLDHFVDVCRGECESSVTAESCLNVTRLASLCEESHKQGQPMTFTP